MIIPPPCPDELAIGFVGRVARLNSSSVMLVRSELEGAWGRAPVRLFTAPTVFTSRFLSLAEFAQKHTLVPLSTAIQEREPVKIAGHILGLQISNASLWSAPKQARWCQTCVMQDRARWGFAFWRRSHNLPAVEWCEKHQLVLQRASRKQAFQNAPGSCGWGSPAFSEQIRMHHQKAFHRYALMLNRLLRRSQPMMMRDLHQAIMRRAMRRHIGFISVEKGGSLAKYALATYPESWLCEHFGARRDVSGNFRSRMLESLLHLDKKVDVQAYALAMALLSSPVSAS